MEKFLRGDKEKMVSVIIPSREERWLGKTIEEIKAKFGGDYQIIVTLDGNQKSKLPDGVTYIRNKESKGMRTAINQAVALASGKYLMKLDAHCMLDKDIDLKLIQEHQPNWVQIPRRKRLNPQRWELIEGSDIDYMKISMPDFIGMVVHRSSKNLIEETETFQGSCYFIEKDYFHKLGLLDDVNFAGSGNEAQEITLKVWKDGGKIMTNKKTWYAHARTNRFYVTDRTKSREHIKVLAEEYGYKRN
jgi:glycosyltransferase involved in cell wall biosynthesis